MAAPTNEWIPVEKGIVDIQYCGYKTSDMIFKSPPVGI